MRELLSINIQHCDLLTRLMSVGARKKAISVEFCVCLSPTGSVRGWRGEELSTRDLRLEAKL